VEGPLGLARIRPRGALDAIVRVPGSRSLTNRALVAAALAAGESTLAGALESDDTEAMRGCLEAFGVRVVQDGPRFTIAGCGGALRAPTRALDARASGTTARFVTALATLAPGPSVIDGTARMRERPIDDLVRALVGLGARVEVLGRNGCPPVRVHGGGLPGGSATIDARRSSQYVSAVLLAAPCAKDDVTLDFVDDVLVSGPYVEMTLAVMRAFGAEAGWAGGAGAVPARLFVRAGVPYRPTRYAVEPDASSAAYPLCAAAIAGGRVRVSGLPGASSQADVALLDVLARMGCAAVRGDDFVEVRGPAAGGLRGIEVDMNALPDAVLAVAVVALFAHGRTTIRNVANLRLKETDRLAALERELCKLGARAEAGRDWLSIEPGPLRPAEIDTYQDHRMAMAFALAGLRVPGVAIRDPACVAKTWPDYFEALERL
jgi:3-phosphoshikimate 1-carboxyvinyltransferase